MVSSLIVSCALVSMLRFVVDIVRRNLLWRDNGMLGRSDMMLPQSDGRRSLSAIVAGRRLDEAEGVGEVVRFWYFCAMALRDALSKAGRLNLLALLAMLLMERVRARVRGTFS